MDCLRKVWATCPKNHKTKRQCYKSQHSCSTCAAEDRQRERIRKRDEALEAERDAKLAAYARQLVEFQAEIDHQRSILKQRRTDEERAKTLEQQRQDLANLKKTVKQIEKVRPADKKPDRAPELVNETNEEVWSSAKKEWEHSKKHEGAQNRALDALMDMIGLEDVKTVFLSIKAKVDMSIRQNLGIKEERFGAALLGNPGTGKSRLPFQTPD
jgi:hypothetical protein